MATVRPIQSNYGNAFFHLWSWHFFACSVISKPHTSLLTSPHGTCQTSWFPLSLTQTHTLTFIIIMFVIHFPYSWSIYNKIIWGLKELLATFGNLSAKNIIIIISAQSCSEEWGTSWSSFVVFSSFLFCFFYKWGSIFCEDGLCGFFSSFVS